MKKKTIVHYNGPYEDDGYDDSYQDCDVYYANDNEEQYSWKPKKVKLSKLVERGHLNVLKYLYQELNYFLGLQRYFKLAIEYGQLEILEWLHHIGILDENSLRIRHIVDGNLEVLHFGECALKSGNVESLDWLLDMGYEIKSDKSNYFDVLPTAIRTKSIEMIQYCFDIGFDNLAGGGLGLVRHAIKETKSVEVFCKMHEPGFEFGKMNKWYDNYCLGDYFEIIKFLRSIYVPWDDNIMNDMVL